MTELEWQEYRRRALKPDASRLGTWTARRWGRPVALRVTRIVEPLGMRAHQATAAAAAVAGAAVVLLGIGTWWSWLAAALFLHGWYVLDHVDGQLARLRRTASLDGTMLDYAMHHSWNVLVPAACGFGLARASDQLIWCAVGAVWGWGALLVGLRHDVRYKAFIQRLKLVHGELRLIGGGGGRPEPGTPPEGNWRRRGTWLALKMLEQHVVVGMLTVVAVAWTILGDAGRYLAAGYVAMMAVPAIAAGLGLLVRSALRQEAETEFAAWIQPPPEQSLVHRDGWWHVE
jgi:hypothetical protein